MKILMVVHSFPREGGAGTENYTRQMCLALQKRNHDVYVLTHGEPFFDGPQGLFYERLNYPLPVFSRFRHPLDNRQPEQEYWNPELDKAFETLLKKINPDVVHFQHCLNLSVSMIMVASNLNIPVFYTLHDYWVICPNIVLLNKADKPCTTYGTPDNCRMCMSMKYRAPRIWLGKRSFYAVRRTRMISALSKCKAVLALSGTVRNAAVQAGFDSKNIQLWLTGIDTSRLHPLNRGSQPPRLPIRFGYTGTLSAQKGIDVILKAFQILPPEIARNTLLYVYGGLNKHPSSNGLNRLLTRYSHPSVTFMGAFTQHSLPDIQQSLDVVIVPSTWYENRPLSILESFAAGNPVVCSNLGGLSELVETSGAGWTFASGNHSQLANVIQAIVSDPDDIVIRRHAIPVVPSIDEEALKLVDLYQQS